MTPAAARPYLRCAATEALRVMRSRGSLPLWPFLASSAAAHLAVGPNARMAFPAAHPLQFEICR
jgi:predicted lysophospholipase L1 biosynthesis ABC-type transport system permease subunit